MLLSKLSSALPRTGKRRAVPYGQTYRYVHAAGVAKPSESATFDTIVKFDLAGDIREWKQDGHYPGESVFVLEDARSENEDDGILMTVVLDAPQTTRIFCCSTLHFTTPENWPRADMMEGRIFEMIDVADLGDRHYDPFVHKVESLDAVLRGVASPRR